MSTRLAALQHLGCFNRCVHRGDRRQPSRQSDRSSAIVLERLNGLSFETAAGTSRKVFCLFWQSEFLSATAGLLRFATVDELLRFEPDKGYSGKVRRFAADRAGRS